MNTVFIVIFALFAIAFAQNQLSCNEYCKQKVTASTTNEQLWSFNCTMANGTQVVNSNCLRFSCQPSACMQASTCGQFQVANAEGTVSTVDVMCPQPCSLCSSPNGGVPCVAESPAGPVLNECQVKPTETTPVTTPTDHSTDPSSSSSTHETSSSSQTTDYPRCEGYCNADTEYKRCLNKTGEVVNCPVVCDHCKAYPAGTVCVSVVNNTVKNDICNATEVTSEVCGTWCFSAAPNTECKIETAAGAAYSVICPTINCEECNPDTQKHACLAYEIVGDSSSSRVRNCNVTTVEVLSPTSCHFFEAGVYQLTADYSVCPCDRAEVYRDKFGTPMQCICDGQSVKCTQIKSCAFSSAGVAATCYPGTYCDGGNQICDCQNGTIRCAPKEVYLQTVDVNHGDQCKVDTSNTLLRTVFKSYDEICNCIFNDVQSYTASDNTVVTIQYGIISCPSHETISCPTYFSVGDYCDVEVKLETGEVVYEVNTKACIPNSYRQCYCSPREYTTVTKSSTEGLKSCDGIMEIVNDASGTPVCKVYDRSTISTFNGQNFISRCIMMDIDKPIVCGCGFDGDKVQCAPPSEEVFKVPVGRSYWNCPEAVVDPVCTAINTDAATVFVEGGPCEPTKDYYARGDNEASRCTYDQQKCRCLTSFSGESKWNCGANLVISDTCATNTEVKVDVRPTETGDATDADSASAGFDADSASASTPKETSSTQEPPRKRQEVTFTDICTVDLKAEFVPESVYDIGIPYVFRVKVDVTLKAGVSIPIDTIAKIIALIDERGGSLVYRSENLDEEHKLVTLIVYIPQEVYEQYAELLRVRNSTSLKRDTSDVTDAIKADIELIVISNFEGVYVSYTTESYTDDSVVTVSQSSIVDTNTGTDCGEDCEEESTKDSAAVYAVAVLAVVAALL